MRNARVLVIATVMGLIANAAAAQQQPGYKPVASVVELMKSIIIPASNSVFDAAKEAPASEEKWITLQDNAVALTESGNLLMMRGPSTDRANWMKFSRALVDAGETAVKAAKAKNLEGILDAGDAIYGTCDDCHKQYMKK